MFTPFINPLMECCRNILTPCRIAFRFEPTNPPVSKTGANSMLQPRHGCIRPWMAHYRGGIPAAEGLQQLAWPSRFLVLRDHSHKSVYHCYALPLGIDRSEERRVGKECRSRW